MKGVIWVGAAALLGALHPHMDASMGALHAGTPIWMPLWMPLWRAALNAGNGQRPCAAHSRMLTAVQAMASMKAAS